MASICYELGQLMVKNMIDAPPVVVVVVFVVVIVVIVIAVIIVVNFNCQLCCYS